ncbi:DUF4198 domain-containing protein [Marinimicrobium sp. C6131]|uniref:DUF6795 domain-containing protein n=1 Tax=Marinimicrobium sp. C6131 TaxID=3022676 RepID=UPI00223E1ACF|nr:DUF6795 domain-containing protein [Marinimicrobium sp. C6131]UZJ45655.1 DUF4198 domain-containing protein [Marinimicrobium sp. C6131]
MSLFDIGKVCVFSEFKARVTVNGEPLKNAVVIRRWEWLEPQQDRTTTDENGYFTFPAAFERSIMNRALPIELVIAQGIYVETEGEVKKIWSNSKREPEENAELGGQPINLSCELTNDMKITRQYGSIMNTLCTRSE